MLPQFRLNRIPTYLLIVFLYLLPFASASANQPDRQVAFSLQEITQLNCPSVVGTPSLTSAYGAVTLAGSTAAAGTVVTAHSPRGAVVGCFQVINAGNYGAMRIYGEDNSVNPAIPGMRSGETVLFKVNGVNATSTPALVWSNDRDVHPIALSAAATTPVAPQLSITVVGTNLQLSWTSNNANGSYEIHRNTTPYFTPSTQTLLTTLFSSGAIYTDTGAAGNPTLQRYYLVRALGSTSQTADSNQVGSISYALNSVGGKYSLIALPFPSTTITNAKTLASTIGNIGALLKWNPATQTFRFFVPPSSGDNFALTQGDAVFVLVNSGGPSVTTLVGNVTPVSFNLTRGGFNFVSLPLQSATITNAAGIASNIGGVTALLSWNQQTQLFRFFAPPNSGDNFVVKPGTSFIVSLSGSGTVVWPSSTNSLITSPDVTGK